VEKIGKAFRFVILSSLFPTALLWASGQTLRVQSQVDRNEIAMGETFELSVTVSSNEEVEVQEPRVPNLDGFDLLNSGQSQQTANQLVQTPQGMEFQSRTTTEFVYVLTPTRTGRLNIPAFEVVANGQRYLTKPIVITVGEPQAGGPRGRRLQPPTQNPIQEDPLAEADEMFNQLLQRRGMMPDPAYRNLPKNPNEAFFIQLELDKTEVFEGEQIVAHWYIYTRGNIVALDRLKFPELKGFWKEIIEEVPALNFVQEVLNGIPYRKALLASHALFPIKPGTSVIDEYKVKASVALPTSPFGSFGMGRAYSYTRASERVKIKVNPLPLEGKPQDFSGAVGQYEVRATVDQSSYPVNQPFSLKIRFEGSGNAKMIELPALNLPSTLEVYDTKSESKFFKNGRSYKEFEVLVIPRAEGELVIPALSFSMFDPVQKKYVSQKTEAIKVTVTPGLGVAGESQRVKTENSTKPVTSAPVLPDLMLTYDSRKNLFDRIGWLGWVSVYVVILLGLLIKARRELFQTAQGRNLKKELALRMKHIQKLVAKGDWRKAATEVTNTLYSVLGALGGSGGAHRELRKLLEEAPPSLRRELGKEVLEMGDVFQSLAFAPEEMLGSLKEPLVLKENIKKVEVILRKAIELSEQREESS
jgi:hypothetical protein